jgi:hypothetical protein
MLRYHTTNENIVIAELTDTDFIISRSQEILDLIGDLASSDCSRMIIYERNFHPDFFNLKTGLAGDILQKFSNYRIRLAIIGDFSVYESKSLKDFIRECNNGRMIYFSDTLDSALIKLTQ